MQVKSLKSLVVAVLFTVVGQEMVFGQSLPNKGLVGVTSVKVIAEKLDHEALRCVSSARQLEQAAKYPIAVSRLKLSDSLMSPLVIVTVNAIYYTSVDMCVANVSLELARWSEEWQTSATVWSGSGLLSGQAVGFDQRVRQAIEDHSKQLVTAWVSANPTR